MSPIRSGNDNSICDCCDCCDCVIKGLFINRLFQQDGLQGRKKREEAVWIKKV